MRDLQDGSRDRARQDWSRAQRRAAPRSNLDIVLAIAIGLACLAFVFKDCGDVEAQPSLESALLSRLRLPSGRPLRHCAHRRGGCDGYAHELGVMFRGSAAAWDVDPWLLAAIAARESSLVEDAYGSAGEQGIMQLHPRSPAGIEARRLCRGADRSTCLWAQIDQAAQMLARGVQLCGGESAALGYYNSGHCSETAYSRSVLHLRDRLRGAP